jgi:malonate transporter
MNFIQSLFIIFAIISIGIICQKRKLFDNNQVEGFEIFLFKIAMPCYLFSSTLNHDLKVLIHSQYIFSYLLSFLFIAVTVFSVYRKDNASSISLKVLASGYVNSAIYTVPILTYLLGNPVAGIIGNLLQVILIQPIFIAILSFMNHKKKSLLRKILTVISSPLVAMPILGLLCNYLEFSPPQVITIIIQNLGNSASSIALFTFGLSLASIKLAQENLNRNLLFMVGIKNFIHPFIAFYIGKYIFNLDGYWLNALVISASAPTAFIVYIIAKQFSIEQNTFKMSVAISSIVSLISLILVTFIFL